MPTIESSTSDLSTTWTAPNLALRAIPDEKTDTNFSGGLAGKIRPDLIPLSYEHGPLPEGGSLSFIKPEEYYLQGGVSEEELEDFRAMTFTLEERKNLGNRAIQAVRFRGKLSDKGETFSMDSNSMEYTISDAMIFEDAPIVFDTFGLTVGQVAQILEDGFYNELYVENGKQRRRRKYFPQYPLPVDRDGT
ncbi:MAG: hypothetical protein KC917_21380, partial [Candidatus Omnitrophica bacterium]|nr:hypothetical protein [Candidatus Omnitrophota bacterium]